MMKNRKNGGPFGRDDHSHLIIFRFEEEDVAVPAKKIAVRLFPATPVKGRPLTGDTLAAMRSAMAAARARAAETRRMRAAR